MPHRRKQFSVRKRNYWQRSIDITEVRQRFLIVCEGSKTEPNYFKKFRVPHVVIDVEGVGRNTLGIIDEAEHYNNEGDYDQVWCVFDKDDYPIDQFENAIERAKSLGFHVAYSNQAFELWYLLHFEFLNSAINRQQYITKLETYIGQQYKKNDPAMYDKLRCNLDNAIKNSEKLLDTYRPPHPGRDDPSTTVHKLVKALIEQARPLDRRNF
jgi:hypothetical protein